MRCYLILYLMLCMYCNLNENISKYDKERFLNDFRLYNDLNI